ncbi:MAG: TraX family protein [Candidatus Micrarchaeia archaeon]|jgi:hypothetical protein
MLKILACTFMLIDHAGALLFPQYEILRIIGRLSLPIFAYLVAVSFEKTSNRKKYLERLILFAIVSQIPFYLAFGTRLNIMFTLSFAVAYLLAFEKRGFTAQMLGLGAVCIAAELLRADYGFYGVLLVLVFHFLRSRLALCAASVAAASVAFDVLVNMRFFQIFCVLALPIIFWLKLPRLKVNKYAYYLFYPGHIFALWIVSKAI